VPSNASSESAQHAGVTEHQTAAPSGDQAGAQTTTAAPNARLGRLQVQFAAETWLEVRDGAGALIYSGTGQAGTERTFEAVAPVSVVIGNARGVRITYNDQALDLSAYAARNIARLTLE
jgi:cytoskeleton protein RodZ